MKIRNFADVKNILFNNLTVKQTIFKNTFWLGVTQGADKFLRLILLIYVARILGATEYGKFTFSLAFVALFTVLFTLGTGAIVIREFAKDKSREKEFSDILSLNIALGVITIIIIWICSFFITKDPAIQKLIWILSIFSLIEQLCCEVFCFFKARQKMEYLAWSKIIESILITGIGLFMVFNFPSVRNLGYSYVFGVLISFIAALSILHFKIQPISLSWNKKIWKEFLTLSWPLALVMVLDEIYNQIDSVMMGYFGQMTQTGWYNAAFGIIGATLIPMGLISQTFFPVLSKSFKESKERLQKVWSYQMEFMIILAFPLVIGGIVLAPKIIESFYGQSFGPSILTFQILLMMVGIIFLYDSFEKLLMAVDQQKKIFWAALFGVITNVTLNLLLIPKYSLYGAAIATVMTHLLIFFLLVIFTLKFTTIKPLNLKIILSLIGAIVSSIIMYFVISLPLIHSLNFILTILIGVATYLICFGTYKKLTNLVVIKNTSNQRV